MAAARTKATKSRASGTARRSKPATQALRSTSSPKTTRPEAVRRREKRKMTPVGYIGERKVDAVPDRVDTRDWFYQPTLAALPKRLVNCDMVPDILDQGTEGACTGFALAAVINFLLHGRRERAFVSPRMLYEMARRYDEWPGESYDGSSARGAMKGWVRHGVCLNDEWPPDRHGTQHFLPEIARSARQFPGGAFYRVMHRQVRDMHAALAEAGALYITLMVHQGWQEPGPETRTIEYTNGTRKGKIRLPVIQRLGRAESGHAVAIVGYSEDGFVILNSWGKGWGAGGFALLPYEDYMMHATDVWVVQLGVPVSVDLWEQEGLVDEKAGRHRAAPLIPLTEIRPHVIDVGNNGKLSDSGNYWTTEDDLRRLFTTIIPERTKDWETRRVLFYLHGGLNDEAAVARRIIAFRDVMLANHIYPLHIMWESGVLETIRALVEDLFTEDDERAGGVADWLRKTRDGLVEAKDWTFELTAAAPGTTLWTEMKENARLASERKDGAMHKLASIAKEAIDMLTPDKREAWELHVVGHSAGSIFAAHAMQHFLASGIGLKSIQFMAPAITTELFKDTLLPHIDAELCPVPDLYILSDQGERDDDVGPYGKSLLYLVSNAFEGERGTPLLGMERFLFGGNNGVDRKVANLLRSRVIIAGAGERDGLASQSDSHGGFDNDVVTMNSVLRRILGRKPKEPFTLRDLQFERSGTGPRRAGRGRAIDVRLGGA